MYLELTTADGFEYRLTKDHLTDYVTVTAPPDALQALDDTLQLAGLSGDDHTVIRHPDSRVVHEGTAAMWVQFEILNYL